MQDINELKRIVFKKRYYTPEYGGTGRVGLCYADFLKAVKKLRSEERDLTGMRGAWQIAGLLGITSEGAYRVLDNLCYEYNLLDYQWYNKGYELTSLGRRVLNPSVRELYQALQKQEGEGEEVKEK